MTTTYFTATTLDGFIATEDDSLEWLFKQQANGVREDERFLYDNFIKGIGAMAMGATTYQWILDHQEKTGENWAYDIACWVFTHREFPATSGDVRFVTSVEEEHSAMLAAAGDRGLWVVGGGDLVGQFADHGWLDEVIVSIAPVTLGRGRGLLAREVDLEFVEAGPSGPFLCARLRVVKPATMEP